MEQAGRPNLARMPATLRSIRLLRTWLSVMTTMRTTYLCTIGRP